MATWYFTNAGGDSRWENITNWNSQADGLGDNPVSIPWMDDYFADDLEYANTYSGLVYITDINIPDYVTGTCQLDIESYSLFFGGNFSGSVRPMYSIYGGIFSGSVINDGGINGGNFTGSVTNNTEIYGGIFSGSVENYAYIYGGYFSGSVTNIMYSYIYGGIFTGSVTNDDGDYGVIYGGIYLIKGTLQALSWDGTYVSIKGTNRNPYPDLLTTIQSSDILGAGML